MKTEKLGNNPPVVSNLPALVEGFLTAYECKNNHNIKILWKKIKQEDTGVDRVFLGLCKMGSFKPAMKLKPKNIDFPEEFSKYTALTYAVNAKNYEAVNDFIKKGANVNAIVGVAPWKTTPLKILAIGEFDDAAAKIFELILKKGGDIMQASSGTNALNAIYECDNYGLMNLLLKSNPSDKVFLGHSLEQLTNLLQLSNKDGILKAFQENGIILQQAGDDAVSFEAANPWQSEHEHDNDILPVELTGASVCNSENNS